MASYTKEGSSQELLNYSYRLAFESKDWCLVSTDPCVAWLCHYWCITCHSCAHALNFEPSTCDHATAPYQEGWSDLCWFECLEFWRQLVLLLLLVLHFGSVPPDVWMKSVVCSSGCWRKDGGVVIHWKQSLPTADCGHIYRPVVHFSDPLTIF